MIVNIAWASIVWSTLQPQVVKYSSSIGLTRMISVSARKLCCIPINLKGPNVTNDKVNELWDILSACSTWHVSKARSSWLFQGMIYRPSQIIQTIWNELMFTVKARYDNIKGSSDAVMMKRLAFHEQWSGMKFYSRVRNTSSQKNIQWNMSPPKWLFPSPLPNLTSCQDKRIQLIWQVDNNRFIGELHATWWQGLIYQDRLMVFRDIGHVPL